MTMTRDELLQQQSSARIYQQRYDSAYASWGMRAGSPVFGVDPQEYRCGEAARAKKLLPFSETRAVDGEPTFAELRRVQYRSLDRKVFDIMEPQLLRAVTAAGKRNDSVPLGEMREIHERGSNGEHFVKFLGQTSFVEQFKAPVRRVVSFTTDRGRYRFIRGGGQWF
jgi:hypothetical protein